MKIATRWTDWLEIHSLNPAYSGWLLLSLALCFFGAATNTMSGWLYVLCGLIVALLGINGVMAKRSLTQLRVHRHPIEPVSAGDDLTIQLKIENPSNRASTLLQVKDFLPLVLGQPEQTAIEYIAPQSIHQWIYYIPTQVRGVYRWHDVILRSATPLGLCWTRRTQEVPISAIVYPQVLPLLQCPLIDTIGQDESVKLQSDRRYVTATEGVTRALRPYRHGDPMRLIHWRTSARLGEFKVRELEIITGGQDIVICLDSGSSWNKEDFESAVIAAASLYFYASRCQMNVKLWTARSGIIYGNRVVLETLATVESEEETINDSLPNLPLVWLTQNASTLEPLSINSRWVFFTPSEPEKLPPLLTRNFSGLIINREESLQQQLQQPLR
ncbi:protein of unknown function DUF58 [Gloeothece citriformis PCC 7424]|uniref:DUF58 domain-containing protein n=1 Tax=Gloeothece citriformis (strain PCC 7424) TaxID=65393 RepID=B7KF96_GLOC7|nr:DUF58 domain-containing protein [Gloeothece citriformis]ACK71812.1 protein of unknown function DUF58 [Gloeothece citriformis PCC 7424]